YVQRLHLVAYLYAPHALYALGILPYEGEGLVPRGLFKMLLKGQVYYVEIICDLLQLALSAPYAGGAAAGVLGEYELDIPAAHRSHLGAVGIYDHALLYHIVAGGDKLIHALKLHKADAAGGYLVYTLEIAQPRYRYACALCRFHYGSALGHRDFP